MNERGLSAFLHPGQETAQVQIADVLLLPVLLVVRKDPVHMEFDLVMFLLIDESDVFDCAVKHELPSAVSLD